MSVRAADEAASADGGSTEVGRPPQMLFKQEAVEEDEHEGGKTVSALTLLCRLRVCVSPGGRVSDSNLLFVLLLSR